VDKYAYLLLGLLMMVPVVGIFWVRRDLRGVVVKVGVIGGLIGLAAEGFYFRDYWRPPSLLGVAHISVEDFLFGFAITALSVAVYPFLARRSFAAVGVGRRRTLAMMFGAGVGGLAVLMRLGVNSIFASSFLFVGFAVVILAQRRDLIRPALVSAGVVVVWALAVYVVLFGLVAPQFWTRYWLLEHTRYGLTLWGHIPVTEMLWYACWALLGSVTYPFAGGKGFGPADIGTHSKLYG
jgi:Lycopene cyclase